MHKLGSLVFCVLSVHLVNGQFSLPGTGDSSSAYPRIKLAGPLGQLIGGQGISLNSGLGQVLSNIISSASGSSSQSGNPLSQLATAASTQYINAIRSLPAFSQFAGGQQQQQAHGQQPAHGQYNGAQSGHSHGLYNGLPNQFNFLSADSNLYGGQPNFDNAPNGGQFGQNAFPHFPAENYFGNQFGGYNNHAPSSGPMASSALYGNGGGSYNGHVSGHHLDK